MIRQSPFFVFVFVIVIVFVNDDVSAQTRAANLGMFDHRRFHYGIQVGYTQSKFDLHYSEDEDLRQDIQGTTSYYSPGFHINFVGDARLGDYLNFRLLPGVTLITRELAYAWSQAYRETHWKYDLMRNVESVYAELPAEFKFRAMRYANFRPYLTAGGSIGFDCASLFRNKNNNNESIVRLNPVDLRYSMGVGFDFFLRYVKFAIEMKMSFGIPDLRVEDDDLYTQSVTYLRSRTFMLSFTFEG